MVMAQAKYLAVAKHTGVQITGALQDCNRNPAFKQFIVTESDGFVILFAVLDERALGEAVDGYVSDRVLHQIRTRLRGKRVAVSNSNGIRYAVLLSRPPKLADNVPYPDEVGQDVFPLGVSRFGPFHVPAERLLNVLVGGASRSGKSTFLIALAYTALRNGYQLYLADPQGVTFSEAWDGAAAVPVAADEVQFQEILQVVRAEMERRLELFRSVKKAGGLPVVKIDEYNRYAPEPLPRAMLIVDEANTYLDQRGIRQSLADIARRSLKTGIHVVLAAHSWRANDIPRSLAGQFATRVTFRVNDNTSAAVVLDSETWGANAMSLGNPGRGIIRSDGGRTQEFQAHLLDDDRLVTALQSGRVERDPFSEQERNFFLRAAAETAGKLTPATLQVWGVGYREARRMVESWEQRGWLAKDPSRSNGRYMTAALLELLDLGEAA